MSTVYSQRIFGKNSHFKIIEGENKLYHYNLGGKMSFSLIIILSFTRIRHLSTLGK